MEKNKIKILKRDFDNYKSLEISYHDISQIKDTVIGLGNNPLPTNPKVRYNVKFNQAKKPLPDFWVCGSSDIISEKFKALLETYEVDAKFFQVDLFLIKQKEFSKEKYYVFYLEAEEDCFDFDNSAFELDAGNSVDSIDSLKLHFGKSPVSPMFFIKDIGFRICCLTEQICKAIEENNITGVKLTDPSELVW